MLTHPDLVTLYRSLRDAPVLSVYVDHSTRNPPDQRAWRVQLERQLADIRRTIGNRGNTSRTSFDACVDRLEGEMAHLEAGVGAAGWAAFISAGRVHAAHELPIGAPTSATWGTGPRIAPYFRSLKEQRPAVLVVGDARRAVIYHYRAAELDRAAVVRAHRTVDRPEHMGTPARRGFHAPTRGTAGHDAAQRALLEGRDRMIGEASARVLKLADPDAWILIGGSKRVAARLAEQLEPSAPHRVLQLESLDVHAGEADLAVFARAGASQLRIMADELRLTGIVETAGAHGLAATGAAATRTALAHLAVRELYVTPRYVDEHAAAAEEIIRLATDQDASVEVVSGRAAACLDQHGGVAAAFRFRVARADGGASP